MKDCHVHTSISHDGKSSIIEYLNTAHLKNVDEITFTEHWDDYEGLETNLRTLDIEYYYQEYFKYKDSNNPRINFGIEIGLQPDIREKVQELVNKYVFDFIIGSSHITCKKDMSMDKSFFEGLTRTEAYLKYFKEVLENIRIFDEFDVYGHIDYVVRYGGFLSKKIEYDEFRDILDEILITLIRKEKGIEINTSGIRYGLNSPHPNIDIIKRYKELGGKIITLGSDAHKTDDLAKDFDQALDILDTVGFKEIAVYHKRVPEFISLRKLQNK